MDRKGRTARTRLAIAMAAILVSGSALANPTGGTVVTGNATISSSGNTLTVTNTPGSIINWQGFSIQPNETTTFVQQSAASTVLNRVISPGASSILGTLGSNGRVYLINPSGLLIGAGATINTAAFVATTANVSDSAFLGGHSAFLAGVNGASLFSVEGLFTISGGDFSLAADGIQLSGNPAMTASGPVVLGAPVSGDFGIVVSNGAISIPSTLPNLTIGGAGAVLSTAGAGSNQGSVTISPKASTSNTSVAISSVAPTSSPQVDPIPPHPAGAAALATQRISLAPASISLARTAPIAATGAGVAEVAVNLSKREPLF